MSTISVVQDNIIPGRVVQARRELLVFFAILIPLTAVAYTMMFAAHLPDFLLLWTPAISAIVARFILRLGFSDVSFRFGGKKTFSTILFAIIFTLLIAGIPYVIAWISGLAHMIAVPKGIIPSFIPSAADPTLRFVEVLLVALTLGLLGFALLFTDGEEIGWRGFMLTRFIEAKLPYPLLLQGLVWGAWHIPFIVSDTYKPGGSPNLALGVVVFMVTSTSFAYFLAWLRLRTGSIYPSIIAHGAWNSLTQIAFDSVSTGSLSRLWIGESGLLVAGVCVLAVFALYRLWPLDELLRKPGQPIGESDAVLKDARV